MLCPNCFGDLAVQPPVADGPNRGMWVCAVSWGVIGDGAEILRRPPGRPGSGAAHRPRVAPLCLRLDGSDGRPLRRDRRGNRDLRRHALRNGHDALSGWPADQRSDANRFYPLGCFSRSGRRRSMMARRWPAVRCSWRGRGWAKARAIARLRSGEVTGPVPFSATPGPCRFRHRAVQPTGHDQHQRFERVGPIPMLGEDAVGFLRRQ